MINIFKNEGFELGLAEYGGRFDNSSLEAWGKRTPDQDILTLIKSKKQLSKSDICYFSHDPESVIVEAISKLVSSGKIVMGADSKYRVK
jgi:hypothetical protein